MGKPIITNCLTFSPQYSYNTGKISHEYHMVDKLYVQELFFNDFHDGRGQNE